MLALATIRQRPDDVRAAMTNRGEDPILVDRILELDQTHRSAVQEVERGSLCSRDSLSEPVR